MTAEIINLRRARKAKARQDATREAAANRALYGQPKAQRLAQRDAQQRAQRTLDQTLREGHAAGMPEIPATPDAIGTPDDDANRPLPDDPSA